MKHQCAVSQASRVPVDLQACPTSSSFRFRWHLLVSLKQLSGRSLWFSLSMALSLKFLVIRSGLCKGVGVNEVLSYRAGYLTSHKAFSATGRRKLGIASEKTKIHASGDVTLAQSPLYFRDFYFWGKKTNIFHSLCAWMIISELKVKPTFWFVSITLERCIYFPK